MLYRTEILKMLRRRQPEETARLERQGLLMETVERMEASLQAYEDGQMQQAWPVMQATQGAERFQVLPNVQRRARQDNLASLDWMIEWEPEARRRAHEEGFEEFPSQETEEDSVLEPYIQEFLPVCAGDRKAAREKALEYAELTGRLAFT